MNMPDLPLLLLPAAAGVVCAALALTAARRRPGAPPAPLLDRPARDGVPTPQNATHGLTLTDAAEAIADTWDNPDPRATRDATRNALRICQARDSRAPQAAHSETTARYRYLVWALVRAAHDRQTNLLPPGVTVRNVGIDPDEDATLVSLAGTNLLQSAIAGDGATALDVIARHAAATGSDALSIAAAEARIHAIVVDFAIRAGVWLNALPGISAAGPGQTRFCPCPDCAGTAR